LGEAIQNAREAIADRTIIEDNGGALWGLASLALYSIHEQTGLNNS
jgi:hypothetical protein